MKSAPNWGAAPGEHSEKKDDRALVGNPFEKAQTVISEGVRNRSSTGALTSRRGREKGSRTDTGVCARCLL